ncbi:MAG: cation:proton antiporter [Microbacterium hominis]|uniref:cation:proton antiporter n=1 Tax=Microbacterium aurum TaxID=36805 RepID=UPI00248DEE0E|nr:cation:proton antiporter [Microbacterium aurum]MBZ6372756.1 cation:proton antiporter [Microbacterium hominis]
MEHLDTAIVLIPLLAVIAPLAARAIGPRLRVPVVVFELALGIVVGPSVLGWVGPSAFVDVLSEFGLAMLFFVAGTEIEFAALRERSGRRAIGGWLISIALGVAVGLLVAPGLGAVVIGIALASTALGTLLPILRDAGELRTPLGRAVGALGAVGEFGPLVAISILLGSHRPGVATVVLAAFVLISAGAIWYALKAPQGALHRFVNATLHTSGQLAVRIVMLILTALVALSIVLDLDMLLGAFAAGIVWRLLMRDADAHDREAVESKVEAIAFGFLVPLFFIYTGVTFDLASLLDDPRLLAMVPLALLVLLAVRGLPSALAAPQGSDRKTTAAVVLLGATGLPIIVAVTAIGVDEGLISSGLASVLVGAGMLSVLLFPLIGMALRGDRVPSTTVRVDDEV